MIKLKSKFCKSLLLFIFLTSVFGLVLSNISIFAISTDDVIVFERFEVNTIIYESLAEVNVSGSFSNPSNEAVQGEFIIDIPIGAYVDNISLVQDNNTYWGRVMRIQEAQEAFENATEENRSATLLTQIGKYTFKVAYSMKANSNIKISMVYFKRLIRFKGYYKLSIDLESILIQNPANFQADFTILSPIRSIQNIIGPTGSKVIYQSNHHVTVSISDTSISEGSLDLRYELAGAALGNNIFAYNNGSREFFVATFSPSLSELGTQGLPKDFVFLIDISGSMSGTKIDQAKTALLNIIDQLHQEDRFGVVSFSSGMTSASTSLVNCSDSLRVDTIKGWVSALSAGGSTNIHGALLTGLDLFETSENPSLLVLLTDGLPTAGFTDFTKIREDFHAANVAEASLFTLGFGNDVNFKFLGTIARENSGEAYKIEEGIDAAEQITDFYESVSTPILKNINLLINSGVVNDVVYPYFIPNLFEGSEIFLVGERKPNEDIDLTISGVTSVSQQNYQLSISTPSSTNNEDSWIEVTWAIARIDDLLRRIEYGDTANETLATVISMALEYGIVTPYTAIFIDTLDIEEPDDAYNYEKATYLPDQQQEAFLYGASENASMDLFPILAAIFLTATFPKSRRRQ